MAITVQTLFPGPDEEPEPEGGPITPAERDLAGPVLKQIFEEWLHQHFPDRARHVLELVRQTRAGALNDARFGHRFSGTGVYADLLARRFSRAARQWGLDNRDELDCSRFAAPAEAKSGLAAAQMSLF